MFIDNGWYGGRYILSRYCNIKETEVLASIQHGHHPINIKNLGRRRFSQIPWLVWNNKISEISSRRGHSNVIPIGSVFLYMNKLNRSNLRKPRGTLVFPLLSHPEEESQTNYEKLIIYLKKNFPAPYTISVSVEDINRIDKKIKKTKNLNFICWGSRGDKKYLDKLINNIKKNQKVVCIYPGSPLIYSLYLKKKVYLLKNYFLCDEKNSRKVRETKRSCKKNLKDFESYGFDIKNLNNKKNIDIAKKMLGEEFIKKPSELIKLLGWDKFYKKLLAKILSKIIDLKEDFIHGYNYSKKRRIGKDFIWKKN
ncbi:hypothetical protein N9B95_07125 [Candidatus Pelagibacter sp.]|nr:hypothetical protein [Candidatus Pelagibacter sp.]